MTAGGVDLEKCVILCKLKFKKDAHLDYENHKTISIGPFPDHESAGEFMRECMDNDRDLKKCLEFLYKDEVLSITTWEVSDLIATDNIAANWADHEIARRSNAERGRYSYSK